MRKSRTYRSSKEDIKMNGWIPVTYRPMTEKEREEVERKLGFTIRDEDAITFACPMPEIDQKILITFDNGKWIETLDDMCVADDVWGLGLEYEENWDKITAWMPLPKPYKDNEKEEPEKGTWIPDFDESRPLFLQKGWKCSACGERNTYGMPAFCMNCGKKMEK